MKKYLWLVCLVFQISACATVQKVLDKAIPIDTPQEIELGKQFSQAIEKEYNILQDQEITEYVNKVGQRVVRASARQDLPYHFKVVNSKEINAFALPGGFVYINAGALKAMDNESQLAGVLAHEVGHIVARHGVKRIQASIGTSRLFEIIFQGKTGNKRDVIAKQAVSLAMNLVMLGHGRQAEFEADELSVNFTYQSGYNPGGMIEFFEKLKATEKREPSKLKHLLASHPPTSERIERVKAKIEGLAQKTDIKQGVEELNRIKERIIGKE